MPESVDVQLAVINSKLDLLIEQRTDHESRLRVLEAARWRLVGAGTLGGAIAGLLAPLLAK